MNLLIFGIKENVILNLCVNIIIIVQKLNQFQNKVQFFKIDINN